MDLTKFQDLAQSAMNERDEISFWWQCLWMRMQKQFYDGQWFRGQLCRK